MARIIKFSGYMIDNIGKVTEDDFQVNGTFLQHFHMESEQVRDLKESGLLDVNCDLAICEKYFRSEPTKSDRVIVPGKRYRHFKTGKIVEVIAISQDTEHPGSFSVVYRCKDQDNNDKIWHRPYDMFAGPVDRKKYPYAMQSLRFEEVEPRNHEKYRVYISGPITNNKDYKYDFWKAQALIMSKRYCTCINPAHLFEGMPEDMTYDEIMRVDLAALETCDAIYMLKGYKSSKGALKELQRANEMGLKVIYEEEENN